MKVEGPRSDVAHAVERVLRTLPRWFGIESSLLKYVRDTEAYPTFIAKDDDQVVGFITVREHFPDAWEVHCIAIDVELRNKGIGRALHRHVEQWLAKRGVLFLQVKTIAATSPSPEYAQTRAFYAAIGYTQLEVFPLLWEPRLPVLQLVKALDNAA
jgi:GNAT superfamily N-acetyltransferase